MREQFVTQLSIIEMSSRTPLLGKLGVTMLNIVQVASTSLFYISYAIGYVVMVTENKAPTMI